MNFKRYITENKTFIDNMQDKIYKINMNSWTPHTLIVLFKDYKCDLTVKFDIIFKINDAKTLYHDYLNLDRSRLDWVNDTDELARIIDIVDLQPREYRFYDILKKDENGKFTDRIKDTTENEYVQSYAIGEVIEKLLESCKIIASGDWDRNNDNISYIDTLTHTLLPRIQSFLETEVARCLDKKDQWRE